MNEPLFRIEIVRVDRFCWAELTVRGQKVNIKCNEEDLQQLRELAHNKSIKLARLKQTLENLTKIKRTNNDSNQNV